MMGNLGLNEKERERFMESLRTVSAAQEQREKPQEKRPHDPLSFPELDQIEIAPTREIESKLEKVIEQIKKKCGCV
jgi:hypothetical protein